MSGGTKLGRGLGGAVILLLALAGGGLIALSPDIAAPMAVLLLPGLIALMFDRSPGCGIARAILLFQAAACVHPVLGAWYRCAGLDECMGYLAEPPMIIRAWLSAAAAWVVTQILPIGLKMLDDQRMRYRRSILVSRRSAITEEWGLEDDNGR